MKAIWNGTILAESDDTVIVENNHYFPVAAIARQHFEPSEHTSYCPWKGTANYFHLAANGETNDNAAWHYLEPKDAAANIRGRVAFWKGVQVTD